MSSQYLCRSAKIIRNMKSLSASLFWEAVVVVNLMVRASYGIEYTELEQTIGNGSNVECFERSEEMAFSKMIFDFIYYRNLDEVLILDIFGTIKHCPFAEILYKRTKKLLNELYVNIEIINDPHALTLESYSGQRTGVVIMFAFNSLTLYESAFKFMESNENHYHQNFVWLLFVDNDFIDPFVSSLAKARIRLDSDFMMAKYTKSDLESLIPNTISLDFFFDRTMLVGSAKDSILRRKVSTFQSIPRETLMNKDVADININGQKMGLLVIFEQLHKISLRNNIFGLYQVYKVRQDLIGSIVLVKLGYQHVMDIEALLPLTVEKRHDFYGYPFYVGIHDNDEEDGQDRLALTQMNNVFRNLFNANYQVQHFDLVGNKNRNGSYNGLMGSIMQGKTDLGLEPIVINYDTVANLSFTNPIFYRMYNLYLLRPDTKFVRDIYLASFSSLLLYALGVLAIFFTIVLKFVFTYKEVEILSFSDLLLWISGIFSMQGSTQCPTNIISASVIILALLFSVMTYNAYAASITSKLTIRLLEVHSPEDLLYDTDFKIGFIGNSLDEVILKNSDDPILMEVDRRSRNNKELIVDDVEAGIARTFESRYAIFGEQRQFRWAISRLQKINICKMYELKIPSTYTKLVFPVSKDSPYLRMLNYYFLKMQEEGVAEQLKKSFIPPMPNVCDELDLFEPATVIDVLTAFKMVLVSYITAVGLVLVEWIAYFIDKIRNNKKQKNKLKLNVIATDEDYVFYN